MKTEADLKKHLKKHYPSISIHNPNQYINGKTKISFYCRKHKIIFDTTPAGFFQNRNKGCSKCGREQDVKKRQNSSYFKYVLTLKQRFPKIKLMCSIEDWEGVRKNYKHSCKDHGIFIKTPNMVLDTKYGCNDCTSDNKKTVSYGNSEYDEQLKKYHGNRYTRIDDYIDTNTKIKHFCNKHKIEFLKVPNNLKGYGCPNCIKHYRNKNSVLSNKEFKNRLKKSHDGKIVALGKYRGHNKNITFKCNVCEYEWDSYPWNKIRSKDPVGCPKCARISQLENTKTVSKSEKRLRAYINKYFPSATNIWVNHPTNPNLLREYDIFIPEKKIAIEFNGFYWHSYPIKKPNYHYEKRKLAELCGIRLITVWETEWISRKKQVRALLKRALHVDTTSSIYARHCTVRVKYRMTEKIKKFYEKNHIQGSVNNGITICLYHNKKLVSCMTFCNIRSVRGRPGEKNEYELIRFASRNSVVGGASKLLKNFEREFKPNYLITYCDLDYFTGSTYDHLGFKKQGKENYTYFTVFGNTRKHKSFTKRKNLNRILKKFDPDKSEIQNLVDNKIPICYSSGKQKYIKVY